MKIIPWMREVARECNAEDAHCRPNPDEDLQRQGELAIKNYHGQAAYKRN